MEITAAERRRGLRKALLILASLALSLSIAAPTLAQESIVVTGLLEKPEVTTYQYGVYAITDEVSGSRYALQAANLNAYVGRRVTVYGTPVPGYQNGEIEGGPDLLKVTGADVPAPGDEPNNPLEEQYGVDNTANEATLGALQAADIATEAAREAERVATQEDASQGDIQAAQEAQQAADTARAAAQTAQQAAAQEDAPAARVAAQEARQASGVAQTTRTAAQDARQAFGQQGSDEDIRDSYNKALQAARSASADGNAAFAAESNTEENEADPEEEAEVGGSEDANAEVGSQGIGKKRR